MRSLLSFTLWSAAALAVAPAVAHAQPDRRPGPTATVVVGHGHWPTEAPPPPREERVEIKPGEVWVKGHYEWKNGKFEWMAGHAEHERAGKHWREHHWENKNGHYELVEGGWEDGGAPTAVVTPAAQWPTEAPPPPREEKWEGKPGHVWVKGRWDWKNGKYEWLAGHEEAEHPGKHWRDHRWENRNGHYELVEGGWDDGAATAVVTPTPPMMGDHDGDHHDGEHHRHDWKIERPTVSSYWPTRGKVGERVIIRGQNFPADAMVLWGDQEIKGAKVTPTEVEFRVPAGATTGGVALRTAHEHGRDLAVGTFEVKADYDAVAEQKRIDDERHKAAEAAWAAQQAKFAHDKAAREVEVEKRWKDLDESRERRHEERAAEIRAKWEAAFLRDPDTQSELTLHAERIAKLTRMHDVAEVSGDNKIGVRITAATDRENNRHEARMAALHQAFGKGGAK
jgi:hypothetical protein